MSQLTFGAPAGAGPGDACGRCFLVAGLQDPYSTDYLGPFNSIVVKVTDLCAADDHNKKWCGQTPSNPVNTFNQTVQCVVALPPTPHPSATIGVVAQRIFCP